MRNLMLALAVTTAGAAATTAGAQTTQPGASYPLPGAQTTTQVQTTTTSATATAPATTRVRRRAATPAATRSDSQSVAEANRTEAARAAVPVAVAPPPAGTTVAEIGEPPMPPAPVRPRGARWGERVDGRWAGGAGAPGGWAAYRTPYRGYRLPAYWSGPRFRIADWQSYGLYEPVGGDGWLRYYDDAVLVDAAGNVRDWRGGIDWDGSAYGYGVAGGGTTYRGPDGRIYVTGAPGYGYYGAPVAVRPGYVYAGGGTTTITVQPAPVTTTTTTTETIEDRVVYRTAARRVVRRAPVRRARPRCACGS